MCCGRPRPRVVIVVCSAPSSCHYRGTNPGFDFLLVSLTWFKPGERLSLANRWMCQYPYGKNTGVRTMVQTGGKLTCTSWVLKPWCEVQPRVATPWCEVQPLGSTPWCEVQPLGSTPCCNSMTPPHAYTLLSCWGESACNHWVKTNPSCNCTLPPTGCIVLGCMRLVRATS